MAGHSVQASPGSDTRQRLAKRGVRALNELAASQASHLHGADPVDRFFELLVSSLTSGKAHLAGLDGGSPQGIDPAAVGWRERPRSNGHGSDEWYAKGDRIGWVAGSDLYLDATASYGVAQKMAGPAGEAIAVSEKTLGQRLAGRGLLAAREGDGRYTAKRTIAGQRRRVLCLRLSSLYSSESGQSGQKSFDVSEEPVISEESPDQRPDTMGSPSKNGAKNGAQRRPTTPSGPKAPIAPIFMNAVRKV